MLTSTPVYPIMRHEIQPTLFTLEEVYRPARPLCSNTKDGSYVRRAKSDALANYAYIETNPLCLQSLVVADVDYGDFWDYERTGVPVPSWRTYTLFDESYHATWALTTPVALTDAARRPPVNLLARVEAGLRRAVGADASYGGRITKNPLNGSHKTTWGINGEHSADEVITYTLKELASSLDYAGLLPRTDETTTLRFSGVGRNVTLFDTTRQWAYRAVKRYWTDGYDVWTEVVLAYALNKNETAIADQWGAPLPANEVKHLARSIAKWVWRRFTEQTFSQLQTHRGKKSAERRWGHLQVELLLEAELS